MSDSGLVFLTEDYVYEIAKLLAGLPYPIEYEQDTLTDGSESWMARNPDLPGCVSQGPTCKQARINLRDARTEWLCSLLEDSLPIPPPSPYGLYSITKMGKDGNKVTEFYVSGIDDLGEVYFGPDD